MTTWPKDELCRIAAADDLHIAHRHPGIAERKSGDLDGEGERRIISELTPHGGDK